MSTTNKRVRLIKPKTTAQDISAISSVPAQPAPVSSLPAPINNPPAEVKPTTPAPAVTPIVVSQPTPTPELTPAVSAVPAAESSAPQKTRIQTNKAIGINISAARIRRHIDKLNLNAKLDALINEIKEKVTEHKTAEEQIKTGVIKQWTVISDGKNEKSKEITVPLTAEQLAAAKAIVAKYAPMLKDFDDKTNSLSRERIRFSNEAPIVLAIICDELIQQLVHHSMEQVLLMSKKIIQIAHVHKLGVEKLSLYPLIKSLPLFVKTADKIAQEDQTAQTAKLIADALTQAEKDFKKKYAVHIPKKKKEATKDDATNHTTATNGVTAPDATNHETNGVVPAAADVPAPVNAEPPLTLATGQPAPNVPAEPAGTDPLDNDSLEDEWTGDSKTSFKYYVHQICKEVMKCDTRYAVIRTSPVFREYLSDLLIELIQRICPLILLTAGSMKNKTVNDIAILRTVESILIDGHLPNEVIELKTEPVINPDILKEQMTKRDDAKKAGGEYKFDINTIPKVPGYVSYRTTTYPTSGFAPLTDKVHQKMELYDVLMAKAAQDKLEKVVEVAN